MFLHDVLLVTERSMQVRTILDVRSMRRSIWTNLGPSGVRRQMSAQ